MIATKSGLKLKLISLGLLFLIPITINLGIDFIYPAITWQDFEQAQEKFLKENIANFNHDNYQKYRYSYPEEHEEKWDEYKEPIKKWNNSDKHKQLKSQQEQQRKFKYLVILFCILLLTMLIHFIKMPILKCPILGVVTYFLLFEIEYVQPYYHTHVIEQYFLGISIELLGIITALICLLLLSYYAYQEQNL